MIRFEFDERLRKKYLIEFPNTSLKTKTKKIFQYKLATTNCSAFSSTGHGDGYYSCYTHRNENGEIDGILIDYFSFFEENFY